MNKVLIDPTKSDGYHKFWIMAVYPYAIFIGFLSGLRCVKAYVVTMHREWLAVYKEVCRDLDLRRQA